MDSVTFGSRDYGGEQRIKEHRGNAEDCGGVRDDTILATVSVAVVCNIYAVR